MVALSLTEIKECMSKLLLSEVFDSFLFIEGEITTFATFHIDGYLKKEFFPKATLPNREYMLWKEARDYCFSLIKGKRTPLGFKFVLGLSTPNIEKLIQQECLDFEPEDVRGLYINLKFDGQKLLCTTGTSMHLFSMDKSLEQAWDTMVQNFFTQKELPYELYQ